MSVKVKIKQNCFWKRKLKIDDIIKLTNLSYGVSDENYRLIRNKQANHTLIYDENKLARGIDLSLNGTDIILILSLPTSLSEIKKFYEIIDKICLELKIKNYTREEEQVSLTESDKFIQYDEEASIAGLIDLQEKINQDNYQRFELFGVYHPISIGPKEINEIGNSLENLENYFHKIQSLDVYYATPRVYKVNDKLIGIYAIGADIPSVVPTKPYIVLNQIQDIEEWYVMLKEGKLVKYDDFIHHANRKEYYDANHVITTLSEEEIIKMLNQYSSEI